MEQIARNPRADFLAVYNRSVNRRDGNEAMNLPPWVWRLQEADMCAAWIDEKEERQT